MKLRASYCPTNPKEGINLFEENKEDWYIELFTGQGDSIELRIPSILGIELQKTIKNYLEMKR